MSQLVDDCCLVCADPLEWTAFGPCGHKEVCSRCVARMRFVLKDNGCVLCRQESKEVFFTKFMGDYTARLQPEQFAELQVRRVGWGRGVRPEAGAALGGGSEQMPPWQCVRPPQPVRC